MKLKYALFYSLIILIILLTILGMIYLKDHTTFKEKKKNIVSDIKVNEASKKDRTKEWVYRNSNDNSNINIPYINIDDKEIEKINEQLKKEDFYISTDYLYSINNNLLSILFIKTYEDTIKYETYHVNLNNTKRISDIEALTYIDKDIYDIKENCYLSLEHEIKKYHFEEEMYDEYYKKSSSEFSKSIYSGDLQIYIGSNKEIMVIMYLYLDEIKPIIINIIDK